MVFGVADSISAEEEMKRLTQEYPEFRRVCEGNDRQDIIEAQAAIRHEVIQQSRIIDRATLKEGCSVNRFEEFYEYFQSFICELESGPMAKRMTKTRKYVVVERLKIREQSK